MDKRAALKVRSSSVGPVAQAREFEIDRTTILHTNSINLNDGLYKIESSYMLNKGVGNYLNSSRFIVRPF